MARPRAFDADATLDTAVATFWRHGYGATTPARLVADLDLSRSSLYSAFGTKNELFRRALRRYAERTSADLLTALAGDATGVGRLRAAARVLADAVAADPAGCLVATTAVEIPDDTEVATIVRAVLTSQRDALRGTVSDGVADGSLRSDLDPDVIATSLLATFNGMQVLARAGLERAALVAALDAVIEPFAA